MSVIERISSSLGRRDGLPNKELAEDLCKTENINDIEELVRNLSNKTGRVASDCLEVLEEIGKVKPELIADFADDFLNLLKSRNNRLIWGSMMALSALALEQSEKLYANLQLIMDTVEKGSVITVDNGISVLAKLSSVSKENENEILPYLLEHLKACRPKEVPQHAERCIPAINEDNRSRFIKIINDRMKDMTQTQIGRIKRILKQMEGD